MRKKLMIVDDSLFILEEMRFLLEGSEFEIVGYCKTGEDAVKQYAEFLPDVVTMDIILPGIDGIDATKLILKDHPDAHVVMVSSLAYDDTIEMSRSVGAVDFIFKPFDKQQLIDVLTHACPD